MALHTMFPTVGHFPILSLVSEMLLRVVSAHVHSFQWRGSRGKHIILLLFLEEREREFISNNWLYNCEIGLIVKLDHQARAHVPL